MELTKEEEGRIVSMEAQSADDWQYSLRPRKLNEYIGQDKVKENLSVFIQAALKRGEALDHVLLYGPPGLGKTTLAAIIANELGVNFRVTSGPAIERSGDLAALLTNLKRCFTPLWRISLWISLSEKVRVPVLSVWI